MNDFMKNKYKKKIVLNIYIINYKLIRFKIYIYS